MKIYCLFPHTLNVDLIKSVGLNIYLLQKEFNYDSTVVSFNEDNYTYLDKELVGLKMEFIEKKFHFEILNSIYYIIKNAKKIDVLRCYHFSIATFIYFMVYKLVNRKGITYLTIDSDYHVSLRLTNHKGIKYIFETFMSLFLFKHLINFATIETKRAYDIFVKYHKIYKEKLIYVPFFINPDFNIEVNKKNQILSVGRIGSHQKASEIVLESFKQTIDKLNGDSGWVLKLVGPISEDFKEYFDNFIHENPELKDLIIITGNIESRTKLYETYAESKIFLLPSRYGSFEIVFAEALFYSNYLIISGIGVGSYLVDISKFGKLVEVDNVNDISNKLVYAINNYDNLLDDNSIDFKDLIKKEFSYKPYIKQIHEMIMKNIK